jgi:hypothetical protein
MTAVRLTLATLGGACALFTASCSAADTNGPFSRPPVAARLIPSSDLTASGDPGSKVASAPTVWVADSSGFYPIAGVRVTFTVTAGGGTVGTSSVVTDAAGIASSGSWQLGEAAGTNTVVASAAGLASVTFTATGLPRHLIAKFELQTMGGQSLPVGTITGGHFYLYDDGTCDRWWDGFGSVEPCTYTLTGQLGGHAALTFFDRIRGNQFATGNDVSGTMNVTYTDFIDFDDEVYKLSG